MSSRYLKVFSLFLALFCVGRPARSQTSVGADKQTAPYGLSVSVDEVNLTFHAADVQGLAVTDLRLEDLTLLDNGQPPRKVVFFQSVQDSPIRAGILMDTSYSMMRFLPRIRAITIRYSQSLLRQDTDQAFVMEFGRSSHTKQAWTNDSKALIAGIRKLSIGVDVVPGTAIFDNLYRTCLGQFGQIDHAASGNFILLFSDGEDNASHTDLKTAVDTCQHANTAIYSFREKADAGSTGAKTLQELATETGGRVFYEDKMGEGVDSDLRMIESDLRNRYRLVYRPATFEHNGSFHHIDLTVSDRAAHIAVRSGYYAPSH